MARAIGISSQLYGQYEKGEKTPGGDFFIKWKAAFGDSLLEGIETTVSNETNSPSDTGTLNKAIADLSAATKSHAETDAINARNIERLVALLERQLGPHLVEPGTLGTIPINKKEKTSR